MVVKNGVEPRKYGDFNGMYPLVNVYITMENCH